MPERLCFSWALSFLSLIHIFASKQEELTKTLVGLTKEAIRRSKADRKIYVAGDVSMTGQQLEPIGSMPFEELVDVYKQQVRLLAKEGVDLFAIETMMSLQECRAALPVSYTHLIIVFKNGIIMEAAAYPFMKKKI